MTEKQLEAAAREYCRLMGIDPDILVAHGAQPDEHGVVQAVLEHSPRWILLKGLIRQHAALDSAIRRGLYGDGDGEIFKQ